MDADMGGDYGSVRRCFLDILSEAFLYRKDLFAYVKSFPKIVSYNRFIGLGK